MILKTEAIVLKRIDFRETSRIATFLTKEYGKVKGVLKGIRKDSKKFGSSVDKFSVNDIVYYQYRNSDIHLISQCDLRNYFFPIRKDLKKSYAASYALELVDLIMPTEERNRRVYELLMKFLESLCQERDVNKLVHVFQIKMLLLSGFRPHLDSCLLTGKKISGKAKFSVKLGGLINLRSHVNDPTLSIISKGTIASLLHIEKNDWSYCLRLGLPPTVKKELKYVLNNFLIFHLGRRLKSAKYLT